MARKDRKKPSEAGGAIAPQPVVEFIDQAPLRLDLACGQRCKEGFHGVDLNAPGCTNMDLLQFPWPWADNSVAELYCSHFVEHIPMVFINREAGAISVMPLLGFKEMFFAFFDECHRVLQPEGEMTVIIPYLQSHRAFQDPTHRRFLSEPSFLYLDANWRKANGLDHYLATCDFEIMAFDRITDPYEGIRNHETQAMRAMHMWNTVIDLHVRLKKRKPTT